MAKNILPKGFLAGGIHCGAKRKRKDLALFYSAKPCKVSALFTKNVVKAAPVILAQKQLKKVKSINAVLVNSGNANCMTGKQGIKDARLMASAAAKALGISEEKVIISSTGVIGKVMNMAPILEGVPNVVKALSRTGLGDAADGISTTDSFRKIAGCKLRIKNKTVTISGVCKGAGMIEPNMATMLCYIMTDADISKKALDIALKNAAEISFNAMSVDGDMSTNDTVILLSNGEAGNPTIKASGKDFEKFQKAIFDICVKMAKMVVSDGEGAHKLINVKVKGAKTFAEAKKAAKGVASSLLVKCAVLGGDPNWGRIASSVGASGVSFDPDKIGITLDGVLFYKDGKAKKITSTKMKKIFKGKEVSIEVDFHEGKSEAEFFSCDISKKYITFNAHYTT